MSFINPITGHIESSQFTYTTTNISVDNVSCINLSATNASLTNLTTITFSPVNVNATNIIATNIIATQANISIIDSSTLNSSNINSSLILSNNVISNEGTINLLNSEYCNTSNLNVSSATIDNSVFTTILSDNIGTNTLNSSTLNSSNINSSQINASQINASYIQIEQIYSLDASYVNTTSVTDTTDKLLLREPNDLGYEYSYIARDTGTLQIVGKNISTDPDVDINFYLGEASEPAIMQMNTTGIHTPILNVSTLFSNNISSGDIISETLNCSTINSSTINSSILHGDISNNLSAGSNITLSTINGITTINSSGGGSTDPLNISVGNISILNTSHTSCDGTLTTSNFVSGNASIFESNMSYLNVSTINVNNLNILLTSSQYAWNATSSLFSNQSLVAGNTLQFDLPDFSYPPSAYVGNGYIVQPNAGGLYAIGFKCFMNVIPTQKCRLSIYKNLTMMCQGGDDVAGSEGYDTILHLNPGDKITIRLVSGSNPINVFMGSTHSWFYGHLLEPINQSITSTTDLTINTLNATSINSSTTNSSTINSSNINSSVGTFPILNTTTINTHYANSIVYNTSSLNSSYIYADGLITTFGNMSCVILESSTANISTINTSLINISEFGITNNLIGKTANYGRQRTTQEDPENTDTVFYYDFTEELYPNTELFTYTTPAGPAATGFRCRKAGWYRYAYSVYVLSRYGNRVQWRGRTRKNNGDATADSFAYTRGADYQYVWEANCTSTSLIQLEVDDYLKIEFQVSKNDSTYGDNFEWLFFGPSSNISFEYLGI